MRRRKLPDHVAAAIRCGPKPKLRDWRAIEDPLRLTRGEALMRWIEDWCRIPEGPQAGQPLRLDVYQEAWILAVWDNPTPTWLAVLSVAKKNGKTGLIAAILLAYIVGPEARLNSQLVSGAMALHQAALLFRAASKMVRLEPELDRRIHITPSQKSLTGLEMGTEYRALSAEDRTTQGISPMLAILDETGQIRGHTSPFVDAVSSSQGAHEHPLLLTMSTQAPSDADMLSQWIDTAERTGEPSTVCHVYEAPEDCEIGDRKAWALANPAVGKFRSRQDLKRQAKQAAELPAKESSFRNLCLNQRVSGISLWIAPRIWANCREKPDPAVFRDSQCALGLDLSQRNDLTAAVVAAKDADGLIHLWPLCYTPLIGVEERARRDRVPYDTWIRQGVLFAIGGEALEYRELAEDIRERLRGLGADPAWVEFDRWRIDVFRPVARDAGLCGAAEWHPVGQGSRDMNPRMEAFETALMAGKLRHGGHPLLTMGAAHAIATTGPTGERKLDKGKASQRIDPLVAAVMAVWPLTDGAALNAPAFDLSAMIG